MTRSVTVAATQMSCGADAAANLDRAEALWMTALEKLERAEG